MPRCLFIATLRDTGQWRQRNSLVFDDGGASSPWDPMVRRQGRRGCLLNCMPQVRTMSTSKTKPSSCLKVVSTEQKKAVATSHNEVIQKTLLPLTAVFCLFFCSTDDSKQRKGENAAVLVNNFHKIYLTNHNFITAGQLFLSLNAFAAKGEEELETAAAQYTVMLKCYVTAFERHVKLSEGKRQVSESQKRIFRGTQI